MSETAPKKLFIVTGDHSADIHAAGVCRELLKKLPDIHIHAIGGTSIQKLATEQANIKQFSDHEIMGRTGLGSFWGAPEHYFLGQRLLKHLKTFQPNAVLLMDYGVFNLWLAKEIKNAQKKGKLKPFPVYYFIPPQVWGSRKGRIEKIRKHVDRVFCIFPFEEPFYQKENIPVTYVGHPLIGQLPPHVNKKEFCLKYNIVPSKTIVGIFPGSRKAEIEHMLSPQIESIPHLLNNHADLHFVLAQAPSLKQDYFDKQLKKAYTHLPLNGKNLPLTVVKNDNHAVLSVSEAIIATTGTVTLEAALYDTPGVLMYKGHPVAYQIFKRMCYLPCLGLPNILTDMDNPILPELWQDDVNPETIAQELSPFLDKDSKQYKRAMAGVEDIKTTLGQWNAIEKLAGELAESL